MLSARCRLAGSALLVHRAFQEMPFATMAEFSGHTGLSLPAVKKALDNPGRLGLVREITDRELGKMFAYEEYLSILNEGTELT